MAVLIINGKTITLPDESLLAIPCVQEGLNSNCNAGVCGACIIHVLEGEENLSPMTNHEKDMGLDPGQRLACQCSIHKNTVKIAW